MTRQREHERVLGVIASLLAMPLAAVVGMAMIAHGGAVITAQPGATITPTMTVTSTATITAMGTATVMLAPTAAPTLTPRYAYVHLDIPDTRIAICDGLAPVVGTVPPPLSGCVDVRPRSDVTPGVAGEQYILYASDMFRYRVYRTAPGWCEPRIVTATPEPSATSSPTITPDAIATAVAGTLTAWPTVPRETPTPRPTDTRAPTPLPEVTPTPRVWRVTLFPLFNRARGR